MVLFLLIIILEGGHLLDKFTWLSALAQFFIIFPAAFSCYFPVKNQMKYTIKRTAIICIAVLVPYSLIGASVCTIIKTDVNFILMPSLIVFFFLYRLTIKTSIIKALAVFTGVCAVQSFSLQFSYAFLQPPGYTEKIIPIQSSLLQAVISCLIVIIAFYPSCHYSSRMIDKLVFSRIWNYTLIPSAVFLFFNLAVLPYLYSYINTEKLPVLVPLLEGSLLMLLVSIYLLFYQGATIILKHYELREHTQLLEMQSHQYHTLKEHMKQTSRLRHDFRHSVHLLSALADKGDIENIKKHLAGYESELLKYMSIDYCSDATLNALFSYYHEMAVLAGIKTDWKIRLAEPLSIPGTDIAALFGNILENAIEGCQTLPEGQRYFKLVAEIRQGNSLYIVSTNSFNGYTRKTKEGYISTKHSGRGTGLVSINAVAEKYSGYSQVYHRGNEFFVDVMIKTRQLPI